MTTDLETVALLRDSLVRYCADQYDPLKRLALLESGASLHAGAWSDYADFGWLALCLPEQEGGLDADAVACGAVMEVVGQRLLMEPLFASALMATRLVNRLAGTAQQAAWWPGLAAGELILVLADDDGEEPCQVREGRLAGTKVGVLHGDLARAWLVTARDDQGREQLYRVERAASGVTCRSHRLVDGRGAAVLRFDQTPAERLEGVPAEQVADILEAVRDAGRVALCSESLGVVTQLLEQTCAYLKVRVQFGRPLASFQALQHRMADLYLLVEEIRALTDRAQQALTAPAAERRRWVSGARAHVLRAARQVGNEAIQMHGGVGVTEELEVSHLFRRLMVNAAQLGGHDLHFGRFVAATLADA